MAQESFDPNFQKHIVASFLEKDIGNGIDCLSQEFFEDEIVGYIAECVRDFYLKEKEPPSKEALIYEVRESGVPPGHKLHEVIEIIQDIYDRIGKNGDYYRGKASDFVQTKFIAKSLKDSYKFLEGGETDRSLEIIRKITRIPGKTMGRVRDYLQEIEERAKEYFETQNGHNPEGRIPTGFPLIDERIKGGLGPGETGVIVAPPKHGKTTTLISIAVQCLLKRRKVLYVTLELSERVISSKFDTNMFGRSMDEIKKKPKTFRDKMGTIRDTVREGHLTIAEFPTRGLNIFKLQELIDKIKPEIVFLDYASIMKPVSSKNERRFELTEIHEGVRSVAGECRVPIWTAHQANRSALDRRIIEMENIAEDFNIGAVTDVSISVNQTEDEKIRGILKLYIMGNRLGSSGDIIECTSNWGLSTILPAYKEKGEFE